MFAFLTIMHVVKEMKILPSGVEFKVQSQT
jgi:hypothetical protein